MYRGSLSKALKRLLGSIFPDLFIPPQNPLHQLGTGRFFSGNSIMPSMAVCNVVVALITALVGAAIVYTSYGYGIEMSMFGPRAGFWPFILGLGLLVISALILLDTVKNHAQFAKEKVIFNSQGCFASYRMMIVCVLYAALLPVCGFYVASALFMFVTMLMLGVHNKLFAAGIAVLFLAIIYLLFTTALHIQLPLPFFME